MQESTFIAIIIKPFIYLAIVFCIFIPLRRFVWWAYRFVPRRWRDILYRDLF